MRFFFYGTLMDPDVCRAVLSDRAEALEVRPALLSGFRRVRANCGNYPVLVRRRGGLVPGLLAEGLDAEALMAIAHFEGREYEPRRAVVIEPNGCRVSSWLFLPNHPRLATQQSWDLRRWRYSAKRPLLRQVSRWMLAHGADRLQSPDVRWHVRRQIKILPLLTGGER